MDVFEKLNRKFGAWYEGLFGGASDTDLRPRDILRRILGSMEDQRREGLDGQVYVPNHYTLQIAVADEDERQYLRTFLDADELAAAVQRYLEQHGYRTRGGLHFQIEELTATPEGADGDRVHVRCRFDTTLPERAAAASEVAAPEDVDDAPHRAPAVPPRRMDDYAAPEELGTVPAMALGSLIVQQAEGRQEVYPLTARGLQIGRSRQAGNDIVLAGDGMVSKRHARIDCERAGFALRDLNSTNGTFVNEQPVDQAHLLQPGDTVRVGATTLVFQGNAPRSTPAVSLPRVPTGAGAGAAAPMAARLVAEDGESYPLASEMAVGRALTGDIVLIGEGVAARHATVTTRGEQVLVEDLGTPGGTFVNGERIPPRFPVAVYEGDTVGFGGVRLRLERGGRR